MTKKCYWLLTAKPLLLDFIVKNAKSTNWFCSQSYVTQLWSLRLMTTALSSLAQHLKFSRVQLFVELVRKLRWQLLSGPSSLSFPIFPLSTCLFICSFHLLLEILFEIKYVAAQVDCSICCVCYQVINYSSKLQLPLTYFFFSDNVTKERKH